MRPSVTKARYQSYLLRIWYEEGDGGRWFFSLQQVGSERRRRGFASLEAVAAFIQEEIAEAQGDVNLRSPEEDGR